MTMLIVCPRCASSYNIDPASLGGDGRTVRCAHCKNLWFVSRTPAKAPEAVRAFVDDVIAEAEAKPPAAPSPMPPVAEAVAEQPGADPVPAPEDTPPAAADEPAAETPPAPAADVAPAAEAPPAVIADAPSLVPPIEHEALPEPSVVESDDAESYVIRRARLAARRKQKRTSSKWMALILVLFAVNAAMISARNDVVRMAPQTAALFAAIGLPVNLRGLSLDNVKILNEVHDGVDVLLVEGRIVNVTNKPVEVPRLRFSVRNSTGQEIYNWTAMPSRSILDAGDSQPFRSRLASPPPQSHNVQVRFFTARDAAAGGK